MLKKDKEAIDKKRAQSDESEKQLEVKAKRQGQQYRRIDWPLRYDDVHAETDCLSTGSMSPVKAALLLRLGETELAEKVWAQWTSATPPPWQDNPLIQLKGSWVWSQFDRAVCAHMRGDEHLTLATALALKQNFQAAPRVPRSFPHVQSEPQLDYLAALPDLIADEQRRIKEAAYTPVLKMRHPPQGQERIAGLIRELELVAATQHSQPGGVNLADDPIVQALIDAGDDAVEPLLDCLENDPRLTRSVSFGRDFREDRTFMSVHEAAYVALAGILQTNFFTSGAFSDTLTAHRSEGRKEVAAAIRAYWQKYKGKALEERWYQTLSDDKAAPSQWLEAAGNIVQDSDTQVIRSTMVGVVTRFSERKPGTIPPMRGELLRAKTNPSILDLLLRRMQDLSVSLNQVYDPNLRAKTELALNLAKWDGHAHLDALQKMTDVLKQRIGYPTESLESEIHPILSVYAARFAAGDPVALAEYGSWLPTVPRENLDFATSKIFELMWQHPQDAAIRQAAEKLFHSKDSPWVPFLAKSNSYAEELMNSPLVGLEAFRAELLRGLTDKSVAGSATVDENNSVGVQGDGGWTASGGSSFMDPSIGTIIPGTIIPGTIIPLRTCDLYAYQISLLEGAPKYQLYWPLEKREQTISSLAQFLQRYGDLYQYQPEDFDAFDSSNEKARIHFPQLDHPATQDDVDHNRAIFSLSGKSRVWKMPAFPMKGSWTNLTDDPEQGVQSDGKKVVIYNTEGRIFQAEEVLLNGKWERFFGFVRAHHIAQVPASEIEFPPESGIMTPLSNGFYGVLHDPGESYSATISNLALNAPFPISIQLQNCSGLDQTVPGTILQPPDLTKQLPPDVLLKLEYTSKIYTNTHAIPKSEWTPVPLKHGVVAVQNQPDGPTLVPTGEYVIMKGDLHDFFDLSRPGTYRLQAIFNDSEVDGSLFPAKFSISENP